jgi:two-component system, NtrC family, sensor kinase
LNQQPKVLVIDDEEAARYGITRALARLDYLIEEASDGISALSGIERFQPDVVVSDINMPGIDGLTLLRRLNEQREPPLVVLVTAYGSEQIAIEALRAGAHNYISKPFDVEELRLVVAGAIEKKRLLRDLQASQTARVHAEKLASLGRLVAAVAHEINNPLGALLSSVDTIRRAAARIHDWCGRQPAENSEEVLGALEALATVTVQSQSACARIDGVVTNLRRFAQLDRADVQRTSVHSGIEDTLHLLRYEFGDNIRVETEFGDLPEIDCAPRDLNQLFMNLLLNSKQAIRHSGRPGLIRIRTSTTGDAVKIEIFDNGRGIDPDHLASVFDPGFTTKGGRVGTDLGLPICQQIALAHQGRIEVESRTGEGTRFTVTLPVRAAEGANAAAF